MSQLVTTLTDFLFSDIRTTLLSLAIGYIVYKISKFYYRVYSLPPGPFPWPVLGNLLEFRGTKGHWSVELEKMAKRFGPVMTLWMGGEPRIFISDIDIAREAFRKNDFAGRPSNFLSKLVVNGKRSDVVFADYGHTWEAMRRVTHSAVQKYSSTEKLNNLVIDVVDHTMKTMIEKEGFDRPFSPFDYIYNTFLNILAASAFGKRYELDDPEYRKIKYIQKDYPKESKANLFFWEFFPLYRKLDPKYTKLCQQFEDFFTLLQKKYQDHYKDYDETVIRDFCDALISARNEALNEGKESAPYLTDENLGMTIFDLFSAGTDTSQITFRWCLLHMIYNKTIEKKLREEIESEIGDRMPTHEDRNRCHYVMAFISETLRFSNIVPAGVQHKAVVTSKLGDYTIPEGTEVFTFQGHILHQEEHWTNSKEFRPERFLENGKYLSTRPKAFIPFGVGRRVCLGEKLAIADLFLVLVRFLQKTADYEVVLHMKEKDALCPDPNNLLEYHPYNYEISFRTK